MLRFGSPTSARLFLPAQTIGVNFVLTARIKPLGMGGGNVGVIATQSDTAVGDRWYWCFNGVAGSNRLRFTTKWLSPDGWAGWDWPAITLGQEYWVGVSYSAVNSSTPPKAYIDGAPVTLTVAESIGGVTFGPDNNRVMWGNNDLQARVWNGDLGELAYWPTSIFTDAEMGLVYRRGPLARTNGLYAYWPLDDGVICADYSGNGRTASMSGGVQQGVGILAPPARIAGARAARR